MTDWREPPTDNRRGLAALVPPGLYARDITWNDTENLAATLRPGDRIDVQWLPNDGSPSQTILANAQVFATSVTYPPSPHVLVLVTRQQGAQLAAAERVGRLHCRRTLALASLPLRANYF
jgi:Flp pilus assembly protein CpaB